MPTLQITCPGPHTKLCFVRWRGRGFGAYQIPGAIKLAHMLELTATALDPALAAATNEYLIAVKAWPAFDQAKKRAQWRESFAVDRAIIEAEAVGSSPPPGLLRRAFKATDLEALRGEFNERMWHGLLTGEHYWNAVGADG